MKRFRIVFILFIVLVAVGFFSALKVSALDSNDVTILSSRGFDDLPDTEYATNSMVLNRVSFGYINTGDSYVFYEALTSTSTRYVILYISKSFYNGDSGEITDDKIYTVNSGELISYQDLIIDKLHDYGYSAYVGSQSMIYTQFNYLDYINYRYGNGVYTYLPSVEDSPLYYSSFGEVNTMIYQFDFYSNILAYYYNITEGDSYQYAFNLGSQTQYESDLLTINSLNEEIDTKNALINDLYGELNSPENTDFTNLTALLSNISTYPIKFFKEGLNVEVWGINVGSVILGVFMLSISLTVIGFIATVTGRRS